jgi:hypothetical protein
LYFFCASIGLPFERHVSDAFADFLRRLAGELEPAHTHHVAALLVIRIGIEQVVAGVFEDVLNGLSREFVDGRNWDR